MVVRGSRDAASLDPEMEAGWTDYIWTVKGAGTVRLGQRGAVSMTADIVGADSSVDAHFDLVFPYADPLGQPFQSITDTAALASCL